MNGTAPDPRLARLVQQVDQERRARIKAERKTSLSGVSLQRAIRYAAHAKRRRVPQPDGALQTTIRKGNYMSDGPREPPIESIAAPTCDG